MYENVGEKMFLNLFKDGVDGTGNWVEDISPSELATCVFVDSRDNLEFTLTSHTMAAINSLVSEYLNKPEETQPIMSSATRSMQQILLTNDIGPNSKVTVVMQDEVSGQLYIVYISWYSYMSMVVMQSIVYNGYVMEVSGNLGIK